MRRCWHVPATVWPALHASSLASGRGGFHGGGGGGVGGGSIRSPWTWECTSTTLVRRFLVDAPPSMPSGRACTQAIMGNVTSRNAVPITAAAYPSQDSVQDYLLAHPDEVIGAVHFVFEDPSNPSVLNGFIVQTNTTVKFFKVRRAVTPQEAERMTGHDCARM
eukprot:364699-Chlamydomonas_euryale.AAC.3